MSYSQAITEVQAAVENISGLTYLSEPQLDTLTKASKGWADGAFLLVNETGTFPWPEIAVTPSQWKAQLKLEVSTVVTTDLLEQQKTAESRARLVIEALMYANFSYSSLYDFETPTYTRIGADRRIVWAINFKMRYNK